MSERGDQVKRLLGTLARNGELIGEGFDGSVSGGEKSRNAAIDALMGANVLKPYDEDSYRLNPRLREFIADHLSSFHAFQALRQVSGTMQQAREQWRELRRLKVDGARRDAARLESALDDSVVEIAYSVEHNLNMLHSLISTQYGNVEDLGSKLRQNRYYARQVERFLRDVEAIDALVEIVSDEATAAGLSHVRVGIARRLGSRRLQWTAQIKDAQDLISKRLFEAKLMEARLRRLSRFALWLSRNRTSVGWDLDISAKADVAIFRPEQHLLRPHPDVFDIDDQVQSSLLEAASKLPSSAYQPKPEREVEPEQLLVADDMESAPELPASPEPHQHALRELLAHASMSNRAVSVLWWKHQRAELDSITNEAWLLYACTQLRGYGLAVEYVGDLELDPFPVNESFSDIHVRRNATAMAEVV